MTHLFRICPTNLLLIEWRADLDGARWGFYRVCDSPNDAKRSLNVINGTATEPADEQMDLLVIDEAHP